MSINLSALQKQRRDTAANWTSADPTLLAGEIGIESDTDKIKIGDGSTAWTSLAYTPWSQLSAYPLVNADIAAAAEIAVSKLANGTVNQVLTTDGTDVSWTDSPTIAGNVTIQGDLTVNGTTTTIDTETLLVKDKNIEMGVVDTPTDVTADGGGITLKGATDKTITWIDSTDAWTFSEHVNIASGKEYRIAGTSVLSATTLGSGVTGSSLTSVGTISSGTWQGTAISDTYLATISTAGKVSNSATTATDANTNNAIVARDASGNFSAGTITADLSGNATTATSAAGLSATLAVTSGGTGQTSYTDGQLLIGNSTGNTLDKATLTAGSGVTITNGSGSISISATGLGGTVTDVTATSPLASTGGTTPQISIQDGTTSQKGAVQLNSSTSSTSTTEAATPSAVKTAVDNAATAQSTADAALPKSGGTMTGDITFSGTQTFPGTGTGTVTSVATGTGLTGGTITTTGTVSLANTAVTPGSYTTADITVDAQGRITAASNGTASGGFASGTLMLFVQTSAPTGWTKSTTHDNKALRIVSGTAGSGGTEAFTTAFASYTPSGSVSTSVSGTVSGSTGATTLTTSQMPSHSHLARRQINTTIGSIGVITGTAGRTTYATSDILENEGGGGSHDHSLSATWSGSASSSFSGSARSFAVQYVDVIIASKD